jgi:DNA-binding MarR family transcriptional regulator
MPNADLTPDLTRMIGSTCLCFQIQRAGRVVGRHFDEAFRPLGLTNWQFPLLLALNAAAPPTVGMLADWLATDRTTVTANLKPLQRRGLLTTQRDAQDGRAKRVLLTDEGRSLLRAAVALWHSVHAATEALAGEADLPAFRATLQRLAGA